MSTAPKPAKNLGGRPRAEIDPQAVERAAAIGCTVEEIAAALGVGERTMHDRMEQDPTVRAAVDRGRATGRATLRRLQWQGANDGNPTMLIWLGKQMLGQRDFNRVEQQQLDKNGKPIDPPGIRVEVVLVG